MNIPIYVRILLDLTWFCFISRYYKMPTAQPICFLLRLLRKRMAGKKKFLDGDKISFFIKLFINRSFFEKRIVWQLPIKNKLQTTWRRHLALNLITWCPRDPCSPQKWISSVWNFSPCSSSSTWNPLNKPNYEVLMAGNVIN